MDDPQIFPVPISALNPPATRPLNPSADQTSLPTSRRRNRVGLRRAPGERILRSVDPVLPDVLGEPDVDLIEALNEVVLRKASDLHVAVGAPPTIRRDGELGAVGIKLAWSSDKMSRAIRSILTRAQQASFDRDHELDFAYTLNDTAVDGSASRFRVNVHQQRGAVGAVFRLIPSEIKNLKALGIPQSVAAFSALPRGLVLVAGPTGSGKSTTLAALVDLVNSTRSDHIVTVEDPIEFLHAHKKSLVTQREVGHDTASFASALKHVLRQDPDVILIGELRDLETIQVALTAAETGHLVFATLHTQSAAQTIDRIIDVFPPHQQNQVRSQLAQTLQGVVCQTLVKWANGSGRVAATEVLVTTPAIANLIREGKTHQIESMMQTGRERGMHTMDQHLAELVNTGQITRKDALAKAHDVDGLDLLVHRTDPAAGGGAFAFAGASAGYSSGYNAGTAGSATGHDTGHDTGRDADYNAGFSRAVI